MGLDAALVALGLRLAELQVVLRVAADRRLHLPHLDEPLVGVFAQAFVRGEARGRAPVVGQ